MRTILELSHTLFQTVLDVVYPPHCAACERPLLAPHFRFLCVSCWRFLKSHSKESCSRCGLPGGLRLNKPGGCPACHRKRQVYATVHTAGPHAAPLRPLVHRLKFGARPDLALPLARLLASRLQDSPDLDLSTIDWVVPVPLGKKRHKIRRYNQAALLAQHLATTLSIPWSSPLIRIQDTPPQSGKNRASRRRNVRHAFTVTEKLPQRPTILLIDDVVTTGATADACARALKDAGARRVHLAATTRALPPKTQRMNRSLHSMSGHE
ncbi:MAG: ComF family protein [Planctomycetota bacterium]|nr:ComF family protein [Planctomycetota bacterium]